MPPKYIKKDPIDHVLTRPSMYVGSKVPKTYEDYVAEFDDETEEYKIIKRSVTASPAILRIFIEVISNAVDNAERSRKTKTPCTTIKVNIDKTTGETVVWNDGEVVPIELHKEEKIYNHTLIFGHLLTGSNYDDTEDRELSGTNGVGIKAVSIFSNKFTVKGLDPNNKKTFEQTWTNNMKNPSKPIVKNTTLKKGYTEIRYFPDFKQFDIEGYTDDIFSIYLKYVIDSAMLSRVKVYFNNDLINVNNLQTYAQLYTLKTDESIYIKNPNIEVVITPSNEFRQISFTNGIYNRLGGQHVDIVSETVFRPLVEKFTKKGKPQLNIKDIKQFFTLFVNCTVVNPVFDSQSKERLEAPKVSFEIKSADMKKIMKWSVIDDIEDMLKAKEMVVLKKTEKKKKGYVKIDGYDPANNAGGKLSHECSLILCEGLSAKTYAVAGIDKGVYGKSGRNWWGILALRGKVLNCRNASTVIISKNAVVSDLIQALGIRIGVDYTDDRNFKTLNYGKVILLTDADSVTFDTPCILKNIETDEIVIKPICEINDDMWVEDEFTLKQYSICDKYLVWSDNGWTKIKSIMRHKVDKPIFRVLTHTGCVDVTEDHSLLHRNGNEITINDCVENETELLHNKYVQEKVIKYDINEEYAYALGYFQADGCCVTDMKVRNKRKDGTIIHSSNSKWSIECIDNEPLEKLKLIFEKYENTNVNITPVEITHPKKQCPKCFKIFKDGHQLRKHLNNKTPCDELKLYFEIRKVKVSKDSYSEKSGRTHKYSLEAKGIRKDICLKYRDMFYNSLREKFIPKEILNNSVNVQKAFLDGFYAGDGDKGKRTTDHFDGEYKSQMMGLFQLLQNCGYTPSLNCSENKLNVYNILMSKYYDKPEYRIKKIINVTEKYKDTYVYDIETENHHFHASIGNIVVHNCDGVHITSLIMNLLHVLYPSILQRKEPYVISMATPIVRVYKPKGEDILFYDENNFREFAKKQTKSFESKYYKGLGTTEVQDVPDTFGEKMIEYKTDEEMLNNMNKAFNKKFADERKKWLEYYDPTSPSSFSLDSQGKISNMNISDFLNNELIKFSHADCKRSIPSLFDGLKESQRKVLYAVKKRGLTFNKPMLKVAQLGGYVAEHTGYHHGEQNLFETIIKMAQEYPGSNNIPLLYRGGMMGTRLSGGKDSASPRYVFTKMETLTPLLFRKEDDVLLEYVVDDGDVVEPKFYVPIIPMILVNGALGIGTGWSSSCPLFNPLDVIECVKIWLENDGEVLLDDPEEEGASFSMFPDILPWYRGFKGEITKEGEKFVSYGIINRETDNRVRVTELPISMWTDKFKETCEDWLVEKKIKSMKNLSNWKDIDFTIVESEDGFNCNMDNLKLYSYLHITNMVLFDEKERIKKYTVEQIIDDFCKVRYDLYTKRKNHIISSLEQDLKIWKNKARFIQEIRDKKLNIMIEEEVVIQELEKRTYDKDENNSFEYLLRLQVRTLTANKVKQLLDDVSKAEKNLIDMKKTTEKQMWLKDLDEFEVEYKKWLKVIESQKNKSNKKK